MATRVAIVGGGLAGLACAKRLVDQQLSVSIYESLPFLGGRASTWRDEDGDWLEMGLHLFLGMYTELKQLLREVGVDPDKALQFMPAVRFQEPGGPEALLTINPLRAPVRTTLSLALKNRYLGLAEKLALARVAAPGVLPLDTIQRRYDHETMVEWWRRASGNEQILERFIRPFCRGIQFTEPEDFSAYNFLGWIHHVTRDPWNALLGAYSGPREETMFQPIARWLLDRGAAIHLGLNLERVLLRHSSSAGPVLSGLVLSDGSVIEADAYVLAIPVWRLLPLLPPELLRIAWFAGLARLPIAPAISVQIWFDRPAVPVPHFTLVAKSPACVYQDLSQTQFPDPRGSRISVIVSPADKLLGLDDQTLVGMVLNDLRRAEPGIARAAVRKAVILRHPQHLVRPLPGAMPDRPSQATPLPNLFVAGDWTQQDFFGSQEGAVRGGNRAADALLRSIGLMVS